MSADSVLGDAVLALNSDDVAEALAAGGDPNQTIPGEYRGTRTLLHVACKGYDPAGYAARAVIAEQLLAAGAKPNTPDSEGEVPIQVALHYAADLTVRVLVKHGADLHAVQSNLWAYPVLTVAAQAGLDWLVERCLAAGADVQHVDGSEGSPLHGAYYQIPIIGGRFSLSAAKRLVAAGAKLNTLNKDRETPLHRSARWVKSVPGLALLLEAGADVTLADKNGNLPIHLACEFSAAPKIRLLLKHGADLESKSRKKGFTPLLYQIASHGLSEQTQRLIDLGADVEAVGKKGETAFSLWISKNNRFSPLEHIERSVLASLLKKGASATGTSSSLTGLLHRLAKGEHDDLIPAAAAAGAPLSTTAKDGWSPLHNAAVHCDPSTVAALLKAGADASVVSTKVRKLKGKAFAKGSTPRQVAELMGHAKTAALL